MDDDLPEDNYELIDQYFDRELDEDVITDAGQTTSPGKTVSEP